MCVCVRGGGHSIDLFQTKQIMPDKTKSRGIKDKALGEANGRNWTSFPSTAKPTCTLQPGLCQTLLVFVEFAVVGPAFGASLEKGLKFQMGFRATLSCWVGRHSLC